MANRWDPPSFAAGRWATPRSDSSLRASDAERSDVADRLSRHFAEGRLDETEFKARLDCAMGATTRGDLAGLFDDLPRLADEHPEHHSRRRRVIPFLLLLILAATAASWSFSMFHVPWVLLAVVGLFVWFRVGHRHHHRSEAELGR